VRAKVITSQASTASTRQVKNTDTRLFSVADSFIMGINAKKGERQKVKG
jgi:hypothetical protein